MLIASGLRSEGYGQATPAINESPPKDEDGVHWVVMFDKNDERADTLVTTLKQSLTARNYTVGEVAVTEAETKDESSNITHCDALLVVLTDNTFLANVSKKIRVALTREKPIVCVVNAKDKTRIVPCIDLPTEPITRIYHDFHMLTPPHLCHHPSVFAYLL